MSTRRILKRDERQPAPAPALHPALGAARARPPAVQRKQQQQRLDLRESCWQACIRRLGLTLSCCVGGGAGAAKARQSSRSGGGGSSSSREVAGGSRTGQAAAAATSAAAAGSRLGRVLRSESEAGAPYEMERLYDGASSEDDDGGSSCEAPRGAIGGLRPPANDRRGGGWRYSDTASTSSSTSSMRSTSYFRSEESVSSTNSRYSSVMHSDDKSCASSAHTSSMNASNEGTYWSPEEQRRRHRGRRQYNRGPRERRPDSSWSRSSSSCSDSITDSTVSLNVITVTLNTDATNFLGISLVGQSGSNGDGGIYVGSVMQGGAVDMDGRIEAGDMILEVNGQSFDRLSNDEAVHLLRDAVKKPGSVTLVVAKCWEAGPPMTTPATREADRRSNPAFLTPRQEPVRPIDPFAWVAHTTALQNQVTATAAIVLVPTPAAGGGPDSRHRQPAPTGATLLHDARHGGGSFDSPSTCSSGDATLLPDAAYGASPRFAAGATAAVQPDAAAVVAAMVHPDSGLDVRDRTWLKVTIPSAFIGSDLVDWLLTRVRGFVDRSEACSYAAGLLKAGYIQHTVNKEVFSEQCYYVFGSLPLPNSKVQNGSRSYYANPACATSPTDTLPPRHAAPQPYAVSSVLPPNSGHLGKSLASSRQGDRSWGVDRSTNAPTGGKLPAQRPLALVAARSIGAVSSELTNSRASFHAAMENPWGRDLCSEEAM